MEKRIIFRQQAVEAITTTKVLRQSESYILTNWDGGRVEIQCMPSEIDGSAPGALYVSVFEPYVYRNSYPLSSLIYPSYFFEKFSRYNGPYYERHGGDLYGTLEAIRLLTGIPYVEPESAF